MAKETFKTSTYDSAEYLDSKEAIFTYMGEALETDDPTFITMALVAKKAGLSRESLYKALSAEGNPEFGTILRVMRALGLKLSITAIPAR